MAHFDYPPHHRARFPSPTEFPDSPSVYSHAYHSPDADLLGRSDFDDETASTVRSLSAEDVQDDSELDDCADDASHRISLQGPKIRFHSRAPWETDDVIPQPGRPDNSPRSGTIGSKLRGTASRADNLIRTFTRGSRPSVDSARSQVSATSSFEVTAGNYSSSRGALYDLARQSMSTSSLASSTRSQKFAHATNYSKPSQHFTQVHSSSVRATVSLDGMASRSTTLESVSILPSSSDASYAGQERSARPSLVSFTRERQSHDGFVHPYANPDLVPYPETIPPHHPTFEDVAEHDSNNALADSRSIISTAFSATSIETSSTSSTSRDIPHGNLRVNGKEISSPIPVLRRSDTSYVDRSTRFLSLHPPPVGFDDHCRTNPRIPAVTLITLQEAQARKRFRSNATHTAVTRSKLPFPSSDDKPEATEDQVEEMDIARLMPYTRARSTSSGTRYMTAPFPALQPQSAGMREESVVSVTPGRTLKHKKSGFMRLFGGRNSEVDKERSPPPPIPSTVDVYPEESLQIHATGKTSKFTLPPAPKSSCSPTLHDVASNVTLASTLSAPSGGDSPDWKGPSRRRQPPSLSIVTKTSDHGLHTSPIGQRSPMGLNFKPSASLSLTIPQSAPPGHSDFPGLKLRPVSTSFSSHFAGMVAGAVEEVQHNVHTPSSAASSNTALFPFTPVSNRRSDDASATAVETPGEECLTIEGLQDQFISAKKAWQQQIWELRGQIRDLTSELEVLKAADNQEYCEVCGRGELREHQPKVGIVNRPRARTGGTARFANGN